MAKGGGHSATPKSGPQVGPKYARITERTPKYVHNSGNNSKANRSTSAGK